MRLTTPFRRHFVLAVAGLSALPFLSGCALTTAKRQGKSISTLPGISNGGWMENAKIAARTFIAAAQGRVPVDDAGVPYSVAKSRQKWLETAAKWSDQ